jgi:DNA polymerase-3 subunit epsilon
MPCFPVTIGWAKGILARNDVVILDTETADLHGEIIEIAVIDIAGNTLLNQRIKPQGEISQGAYWIHGISLEDLKDCPSFPDVYPKIKEMVKDKLVVIYNASYDTACLARDYKRHDMSEDDSITIDWSCAMLWFSQYVGDWSRRHRDYRWQSLPSRDHSALGDCKATLDIIRAMAQVEPIATD